MVNRGEDSLKTLKFIYNLPNKKVVLGNHDIALLEMYYKTKKPNKYLAPILEDKMCDELIQWIRVQPLFVEEKPFCFCHAGLFPKWNIKEAVKKSKQIEKILQSDDISEFLKYIHKDNKQIDDKWQEYKEDLYKFILMRYLTKDYQLNLEEKKHPKDVTNLTPWFELLPKQSKTIIFGHWASLGFYEDDNVKCIDGGFIWGGEMIIIKVL